MSFLSQSNIGVLLFVGVIFVVPLIVPFIAPRAIRSLLGVLADRPRFVLGLVFAVSLGISGSLTHATGVPPPTIHDEFSYLLAADTFAHGRLTNPPSPFFRSFDTFHVLQQPTYQSKYPPAQGLFLAFGKILTGFPITGAWIEIALAATALSWMFYAWFPRRWALLGSTLVCLHPAMMMWSQCYWGGGAALLAGALLFGGIRRFADVPLSRYAFTATCGAGLLVLSRPYEGLTAILIACGMLLIQLRNADPSMKKAAIRAFAPALVPLVLALGFTGLYDRDVTGSVIRLPYALYESAHFQVPAFLFQHLKREPTGIPPAMHAMNGYYMSEYLSSTSSVSGIILGGLKKLIEIWRVLLEINNINAFPHYPILVMGLWQSTFQFALFVPILWLLAAARRDRWLALAFVGACLGAAALVVETWFNTHYAAPFAPLGAVLLLGSLRQLNAWTIDRRRIGKSVVGMLVVIYIVSFFVCFRQEAQCEFAPWAVQRTRIESMLERESRPSIVLVRYSPKHFWGHEWVYNGCDLERDHVLWARSIDPVEDSRLLAHYHGRQVWLLEPDKNPATLTSYSGIPATDTKDDY